MNKNELSIYEDNKEYNNFETKIESDYLYERLQKLKNLNNNINDTNLQYTSFQKYKEFHEIKKNIKNEKNLFRTQSQKNFIDKRIKFKLKNYGLNNLKNVEKIDSNIDIFNSKNGNIFPELIKSKNNNYSLFNVSFKDNFNSSNISFISNSSIKYKYPLKEINLNKNYVSSISERTNNTSYVTFHKKNNNLYYLRKYIINKNNRKNILNKSSNNIFNNINNKNVNCIVSQENKNILFNDLTVKTLPNNFFQNKITNENNNTVRNIDLKIKELLERKKSKNLILKKEEEKKQKQIYSSKIANYFDSIPNLIIKANIEKNEQNKNLFFHNLINKYFKSLNIKLENINDKGDKLFNHPIIKYIFLQKILKNLTHKIDFKDSSFDKYNDIILNNFNIEEFNSDIKDFITYGYEFMPENLLKMKNYEENKDNKEIIKKIKKVNNLIEKKIKNLYNNPIKIKDEDFKDIRKKAIPKYLYDESNSNLMIKFLEQNHYKKNNLHYKKTQNRSTMVDIQSKYSNKDQANNSIHSELKNILYRKINKINEKYKNEIEKEKIIQKKENFWNKIMKNNNKRKRQNSESDRIYIIKEIRSKNITPKNTLNKSHNSILKIIRKDKRVKSTKLYIELLNEKEKQNYDKIKKLSKNNNISQRKSKIYSNINSLGIYRKYFNNIKKKKKDVKKINSKNIILKNKKYLKGNKKRNSSLKLNKQSLTNKNIPKKIKSKIKNQEENYINIDNQNNIINGNDKNSKNFNLSQIENDESKIENISKDNNNSLDSNINNNNSSHIFNPKSNEEKKIRYYAIIKKIVTSRNLSFLDVDFSSENPLLANYEKENVLNLNDSYSGIINISNNNSTKKRRRRKEELNLLDKFLIYYKRKIFYERELHKAHRSFSKIVDEENKKIKKPKKRGKFYSLFEDSHKYNKLEENKKEEKEEKEEKIYHKRKPHFINLKNLNDIERKKVELLYKFKNDISFKISKGEINLNEMDNFIAFENKINGLKKNYEDFNIDVYVKELEEFFYSFEKEIIRNEQVKKEEERINNYLRRLNEDFKDKNYIRKLYEQKLCKIIDYSEINHINILNESKSKDLS